MNNFALYFDKKIILALSLNFNVLIFFQKSNTKNLNNYMFISATADYENMHCLKK